MGSKRVDWRIVGIALIPALGFSIGVVLLGGMLGLSDSVGDRVSQVVFFPVFLAAYLYIDRRRSAALLNGMRASGSALDRGAPDAGGLTTVSADEHGKEAASTPPRR